ncbi:MAG: hypothetical protein EU536_02465 [Promethearchaeota archaeon]|nr:MAG: hypothetical protein EU536_02465 [Candidatus Lokiarchaeota archaeon]
MSIEYVQKSKIWAYFKEKGIRVSGDAKSKIIEMVNNKITEQLDGIIDTLPTYTKGEHKGEPKRKTLKLEDLK